MTIAIDVFRQDIVLFQQPSMTTPDLFILSPSLWAFSLDFMQPGLNKWHCPGRGGFDF
jgi:hypothetical protein